MTDITQQDWSDGVLDQLLSDDTSPVTQADVLDVSLTGVAVNEELPELSGADSSIERSDALRMEVAILQSQQLNGESLVKTGEELVFGNNGLADLNEDLERVQSPQTAVFTVESGQVKYLCLSADPDPENLSNVMEYGSGPAFHDRGNGPSKVDDFRFAKVADLGL